VTGVADAERLAGERAGCARRVHRTQESGDRLEAVAHTEVSGIVPVVPGPGGLTDEHRDRDLITRRARIGRQVFRERILERHLALIDELADRDGGEDLRYRSDVDRKSTRLNS